MVDYDYYKNDYLGTAISPGAFPALEARAREALQAMKNRYRVSGGPQQEAMAICAMAEVLDRQRPGILSASAGSVTVRYREGASPWAGLVTAARMYLDIYRGVGT